MAKDVCPKCGEIDGALYWHLPQEHGDEELEIKKPSDSETGSE